jgi:hypothetical protein
MRYRFILLCALCAHFQVEPAHAQSNTPQQPRAVAAQYADGRTIHHALKPNGSGGWTTLFPRIAGAATDRNGLALSALDLSVVMDGLDAKVAITLVYGRPPQHRIPVATVNVTAKGPVTADQLTTFGVEPVSFSIVPVHPSALEAPTVASASASLVATVELADGEGPTFRVMVRNFSTRAVRGFGIEGTHAGRKAVSAYRRGPRQSILISPGAAYAFEVPTSVIKGVGGITRVAPDRVLISSVTWDDGAVEGDTKAAAGEYAVATGTARQLPRVLALMQDAGDLLRPQALAELRGRIAGLPIDVSPAEAAEFHKSSSVLGVLAPASAQNLLQIGMQQVRQLVLADLDAFVSDPTHGPAATWLSKNTAAYEEWLARATSAQAPSRSRQQ